MRFPILIQVSQQKEWQYLEHISSKGALTKTIHVFFIKSVRNIINYEQTLLI